MLSDAILQEDVLRESLLGPDLQGAFVVCQESHGFVWWYHFADGVPLSINIFVCTCQVLACLACGLL